MKVNSEPDVKKYSVSASIVQQDGKKVTLTGLEKVGLLAVACIVLAVTLWIGAVVY